MAFAAGLPALAAPSRPALLLVLLLFAAMGACSEGNAGRRGLLARQSSSRLPQHQPFTRLRLHPVLLVTSSSPPSHSLLPAPQASGGPEAVPQHHGRQVRILYSRTSSPLPSPRPSVLPLFAVRWLSADDRGTVCRLEQVDSRTGCCKQGTKFSCETFVPPLPPHAPHPMRSLPPVSPFRHHRSPSLRCVWSLWFLSHQGARLPPHHVAFRCLEEDNCCAEYEHCVSCCMRQDHTPVRLHSLLLPRSNSPLPPLLPLPPCPRLALRFLNPQPFAQPDRVQTATRVFGRPETGHWGSVFELCRFPLSSLPLASLSLLHLLAPSFGPSCRGEEPRPGAEHTAVVSQGQVPHQPAQHRPREQLPGPPAPLLWRTVQAPGAHQDRRGLLLPFPPLSCSPHCLQVA